MKKLLTLLFLSMIIAFNSGYANNIPEITIDLDRAVNAVEKGLTEVPSKSMPELQADKKYMFFNNLDPDFSYILYYNLLNGLSKYNGTFLNVSFSDATFSQYDITDFDVAIFPMLGLSLNARTQSGNNVIIDKINEMIDAEKEVIIISFGAVYLQYDPNAPSSTKSDDVDEFLSGFLGINYSRMIPQIVSQTYDTFLITGSRYNNIIDSVTKGTVKFCNGGINNISPMAYVQSTEAFTLDEREMQFSIDHYDSHTGTELCGVRRNFNGSRVVFWSYPFAVIAGTIASEAMLQGAMNWVTAIDKSPGAIFEHIESSKVDFGIVNPGESRTMDVQFANIGAVAMNISEIYFDWNEEGAYKITEGDDAPFSLEPYESHTITIEFSPPTEDDFPAFLVIENDSDNDASAEFDLSGSGGRRNGAFWTTNIDDAKIDFGYAEQFGYVDIEIIIKNIGQVELIINYYDFDAGEDEAFDIRKNDYYPVTIEANESFTQTIRFVPMVEDVTYKGSIKYNTNASNGSEWIINFVGREGLAPGARIQTSMDNQHKINFSKVTPNETKTVTFDVINSGNIPLNLFSFEIDNQDHDAYSLASEFEYPIVITVDSSISVDLSFTPTTPDKIYQGSLLINTNAINENPFNISLYGIADKAGAVPTESISNDGMITLNVTPNPANDYAEVSYELNSNSGLNIDVFIIDINGKRVMDISNGTKYSGKYNETIDLTGLPSGQFIVVVNAQNSIAKFPIIVVR